MKGVMTSRNDKKQFVFFGGAAFDPIEVIAVVPYDGAVKGPQAITVVLRDGRSAVVSDTVEGFRESLLLVLEKV